MQAQEHLFYYQFPGLGDNRQNTPVCKFQLVGVSDVERFSELWDLQIGHWQGNEIIVPVISCVIGVIDRLEIFDAGGLDVWLD